jgi:hypothetical protein
MPEGPMMEASWIVYLIGGVCCLLLTLLVLALVVFLVFFRKRGDAKPNHPDDKSDTDAGDAGSGDVADGAFEE